MSTYKIHVTKEDIGTAVQGDPNACMVWRAINRQLQLEAENGTPRVEVDVNSGHSIIFRGDNGDVRADVEQAEMVSRKINRWDESERPARIQPFEFDMNLPDDWREQVTGGTKYDRRD